MIQPRNTLVLLKLIEQSARQVGKITVPTNGEHFTEAEVVMIGPGNIVSEGGVSDTFDLKVGQRVLVLHKDNNPRVGGKQYAGIPVQRGDETFYLYEQARILAIIAEPGIVQQTSPILAA